MRPGSQWTLSFMVGNQYSGAIRSAANQRPPAAADLRAKTGKMVRDCREFVRAPHDAILFFIVTPTIIN